ncbi:MAG: HAD family hydrolase [Planctomycetota bacterium]|nr:MAG: HAD family hydrolase [Planctomycetota bacterium]
MNVPADTKPYLEIIRRHSRPLAPIGTSMTARLRPFPTVRALLFDIYGTLLISGSGDIGVVAAPEAQEKESALRAALAALGIEPTGNEPLTAAFEAIIREHHERRRASGVAFPEVDILAVWRDFVSRQLGAHRLVCDRPAAIDWLALALEYEMRVNPVWPMPGAVEMLDRLSRAGIRLGVISNAQSFTPLLFPALTGRTLQQLGIDESYCFYSYRFAEAKPSVRLYRAAAERLARDGITADQALYVGNDMLNDIWPARRVGFRTALFAGDARSLRLREDDPRIEALQPDLIVTDWDAFTAAALAHRENGAYE